ncbi:MAG: DUF4494 domain-containing protein [Prevotellaceae bacterium]|jgi:hypothetical protein|nr:DUF4494 domain-containing protein [Prevotellaceae bacterium]
MSWFECKIKYEKNMGGEEGVAKVSETYLVDAMSFTEAEERVIKEMTPFISGDFEVANIRKLKITEMFQNPSGDRWYRSKVNITIANVEEQTEKTVSEAMLIQASSFKDALETLEKGLKGTLAPHEIVSLTETPIMDVYFYDPSAKAPHKTQEEIILAD